MKKHLLLIFTILLAVLSSCKKDAGVAIPGGSHPSNTTNTYQPLTTNSYWTYQTNIGGTPSYTSTNKITGGATLINNKTYYDSNVTSTLSSTSQLEYYYVANHIYSVRSTSQGYTIDMMYLNDSLPVGSTWTGTITDNGSLNGVPAQANGKIMEIGISKTVSGKVFNNVIHTKVTVQYNYGFGFTDSAIYDYYIALNIGVIEIDSDLSASVGMPYLSTTILTDYAIK